MLVRDCGRHLGRLLPVRLASCGVQTKAVMVKKVYSRELMRRVNAPYVYAELMKQDWVTRHVSLSNLRRADLDMYCYMLTNYLSPADALKGIATCRSSYSIHWLIPLGYVPLRRMTLCKLFKKPCRRCSRQ